MNTKKIGSYPTASVLITVATALFMVGLFALLALHATTLTDILQKNIEIQVYLERDIDEASRNQILESLSQQEFVEYEGKQARIRFLSKEQAAQKLMEETGENFIESLGTNPLRDTYLVNIKRDYYNKEKLTQIRKKLEATSGIYEVVYSESMIEKINQNLSTIGGIIIIFVIILIITVFILLNNAIKLALFSQRFLIRSMQLVGATDLFIKKPYLKRAAWQGLLGGLVACILLSILLLYLNVQIPELKTVQSYLSIVILFVGLILIGIFICLASAYFSANRYLNTSLDELY
jgi:cell division transport system permease protein